MQRALLLIIITTLPQVTFASWDPWPDQRVVSDNGEYYVVMCRAGRPIVFLDKWAPVAYRIAKRGENTPPVKPAKSTTIEWDIDKEYYGFHYKLKPNPNVTFRDNDKILGDGILKRPPGDIIVSSDGLGFAGISVYGNNDYGYCELDKHTGKCMLAESDYAVILVSSSGKVLHRILLHDLFTDDEQDLFYDCSDGIFWHNIQLPGWFIESKKQLVVVGVTNRYKPNPLFFIRYIDWQTGKITKGPTLKTQKDVKKFKRESQNVTRKKDKKKGHP